MIYIHNTIIHIMTIMNMIIIMLLMAMMLEDWEYDDAPLLITFIYNNH